MGIDVNRSQRWQGKLSYPVVGTARYFKPESIGDLDSRAKKNMTEEDIHHKVTAADEGRSAISVKVFKDPIYAPGMV